MAHPAPVLVVDDDAVSRHVLTATLRAAGLKTAIATSGSAALDWLAENTPSLVLLDLVMPPPDGFAVLRALRATPRTADLPVLVLTALDSDDDVSKAFDMGADDFVRKPFRPAELIARIRGQLRMREYVEALGRKERDAKVVLELTQALSSTLDFSQHPLHRRPPHRRGRARRSVQHRPRPRGRSHRLRRRRQRRQGAPRSADRARQVPGDSAGPPRGRALVIEDIETHPLLDLVRAGMPENSFRSLALLPIVF